MDAQDHRSTRSRRRIAVGACFFLAAGIVARPASGQGLRGSMASVDRQNLVAREHDYSFLQTGERVRLFAARGLLVRVRPNADFTLRGVSFPYARPEVELFVRRLGAQYRANCGEQLVVTSLTRPTSEQPANASDRSVHPTGMAVDLRTPRTGRCRSWLEGVLLSLERQGVAEATLERFPVHYHVAVFPRQYAGYVAALGAREPAKAPAAQVVAADRPAAGSLSTGATVPDSRVAYRVRRGDSLWTIARQHGTTVTELRSANQIRGSKIFVGQVLDVPLEE